MMAKKSRVEEIQERLGGLVAQRQEQAAAIPEPTLDDQIAAAQEELKAATGEAKRAAIEALRPKEREQTERIVKLAGELQTAVEALGVTHREIGTYGAGPKAQVPIALYQGLVQAGTVWRMYGHWQGEGGSLRAPKRPEPPAPTMPKSRQGRLVRMGSE